MSKTNIVIDGNFMFHRTLFAAKGYGKLTGGKRFLDSKDDEAIFMRKVASDFVSTINQFKSFNRVIFTKDSKSWRAQYYPEYKANRKGKKDDDVNWDQFYYCMNRFCKIIEKSGVVVSDIEGAEGDDLIALWAKYLNSIDENVIVVTADGDLTQTIAMSDKAFTIIYNNKSAVRKLIAPTSFYEWINERKHSNKPKSLFDSGAIMNKAFSNDGASMIAGLLDELNYEEVEAVEIAFKKVICGDDGDNIPSIWEWGEIKETGRYTKRITPKDYVKAVEFLMRNEGEINLVTIANNLDLQNRIRIVLENSGKTKIPLDEFRKRLDRNLHLVVLNENFIDNDVQERFREELEEIDLSKNTFAFDRISLLKGTEFAKEPVIKIVSDAY